ENRAELFGLAFLFRQRLLELVLGYEAFSHQEVPEATGLGLPEFCVRHLIFLLYSTYPLQCVTKGSVRIVEIQDEKNSLQRGLTRFQVRDNGRDHRVRGGGRGHVPDPRTEGR